MHYTQDPLWQKIEAYAIDDKHTAYPFSAKLAAEQNWTSTFTIRAIEEYKKFIYLCCILPQGASPPHIVDEVWHMHLTYTKDYWQRFCRDALGKEVHHTPSAGGQAEDEKYSSLYTDTLKHYIQTFGKAPPQDIWPDATGTKPYLVPDQYFFEAGPHQRFLILLLPFLLTVLFYQTLFPFHLNGPHFLVFYCMLASCAWIVNNISFRAKQQSLERLPDLLNATMNKYELAFLAGGENRLLHLCLADLISREYLIFNGIYSYRVNISDHDASDNPLYPYLEQYADTDGVALDEFAQHRPDISTPMYSKYKPLLDAYARARNNLLLPGVVLLLGIARSMQGVDNDEPITLLIMLMIGFSLATLLRMKHESDMHRAVEKIVEQTPEYVTHINDTVSRKLLLYGINGIAGIMVFHYLSDQYKYSRNNTQPDGSGTGCSSSSCSSGCGSSCGSGCGGCGGD